jgi:hypothetical protein
MCARGRRTSATRPGGFTLRAHGRAPPSAYPRPTAQAERPRWLSYPRYLPAIWQDMTVGGDETVSALVWWVIPIAITAIAIAVVSLRSRIADPRTDPMADRARLREAMERPIPRTHRGPAAK